MCRIGFADESTVWCRGVTEKLTVTYLVKKLPDVFPFKS